ncbi:alpha-1,2-fucosyltransferase [Comamonas flocculans]|uniref:Alpha-1,2-fucosyltransferase n=1 Tax=Comamonas flocculans TaxID=2597701 RepID=A0A5B8RUR3_9BURK|nr:alpha-1,2-fucosyltransferase [Comamonas flocculans]QEA12482.1 hypothetical protein FOZ74_05250 [Comamonas flocculans]
MITFSKLGNYGRLGNQLFQYAYLRSMALRLGTDFWCPQWDGDRIFDLHDEGVRINTAPEKLGDLYDQGVQAGFSMSALMIKDGVDIQGYFQSEKYYQSRNVIREWYKFSEAIVKGAGAKFDVGQATDSVSISLRLDEDYAKTREFFPMYPPEYYSEGIAKAANARRVLVFADRIDLAKKFAEKIECELPLMFVEKLSPPEQLWLMTRCTEGNVLVNSTFAWWGGYLNANENAVIVAPKEWVRPGVPVPIVNIVPDGWIKIDSLHPIWDNFQIWRITHPGETLRRVLRKFEK